jgi:hypothetical protein
MSSNTKTERNLVLYGVVAILLFLSLIFVVRSWNDSGFFPNGESYYNLRLAAELVKDPYLFHDDIQNRSYTPSVLHILLAVGLQFLGSGTYFIFPILTGVLCAFVFYKLMKVLGMPKKNAFACMLLLAATPPFIYAYTTLSSSGLTALLSVTVLFFYFHKDYWEFPWKMSGKIYFGISIFVLSALAVTSLLGFAITLIFISIISIIENRNIRSMFFASSFPAVLLIPFGLYTDYFKTAVDSMGFHQLDLRQSFSIFGSPSGIDLFFTIIAIMGMIIVWNYIKDLRVYHLVFIAFVACSLINPLFRIYSSMIMTVYCVVAIKHLYYRKWELEITKTGTMILIFCAIVFSILNQVSTVISSEPTSSTNEFFDRAILSGNSTILTDPDYGYYVQWISGRQSLLDGSSFMYPDYVEKYGDYEYLMGATKLKDAQLILDKYSVDQIIITPQMKENLWNDKEQGLMLVLRNSPAFSLKDKSQSGLEHWQYLPR